VILLELGDFASTFDEAGLAKTTTYVKALDQMGYDAVGIGESEIAGGLDACAGLFSKVSFPVLSASFTLRDSEATYAKPYVIKTYDLSNKRHVRIAFLALSAYNSLLARTGDGGKVVVSRDPADQARRYMPELSGKADMVVLLANLSPNDLARVAQAVPAGIDIALAAFGDRLSMGDIEDMGGIKAFYAGNEGKRLGEIRVFLDGTKIRSMTAGVVHLTKRYPEEPRFQQMVNATLAKVNDIMKNLTSLPAQAQGSGAPAQPAPAASRRYLTSSACKECHKEAFRVWDESAHATAMQTLVKASQDFNPECVKCHTTGYGTPEGFQTARITPMLTNVHCEACHGSGAAHVLDAAKPYGRVSPRVCFTCHTKENSPDFSFFKYWEQIKH